MRRYSLSLLKSSNFGSRTGLPYVTHLLKLLTNALHAPMIFFHQKFSITQTHCADQLFLFLIVLCSFFSLMVNTYTLFTFSLKLFAVVFIHFHCGVLVLSSQIPSQKSSIKKGSIFSTFPFFLFFILGFSIKYFFVLFKYYVISDLFIACFIFF